MYVSTCTYVHCAHVLHMNVYFAHFLNHTLVVNLKIVATYALFGK